MTSDRPAVGTRLLFRWRKWDGSPHWVHECVYLGADEWGDWFGQLPGWRSARPGRDVTLDAACVVLLPSGSEAWTLTRNALPSPTRVYIDLAWEAKWDGRGEPTAIDMDLDVVHRLDERGLYIDDRDEWDEHRAQYGYPADVQESIEAVTAVLEREVRDDVAPFDDATTHRWFAVLADLELV
ncbi:hypothetical protein GCM10022219_11790 [Microbacterium oryzae]|uniref:DUF402 domain-containing protein n=1 Tax=Microbacterium oryzae TaxID=743009 RepID=A0A6I6DTY0_9MICO|nr:DUF402 domain-containing protein [Microbacterium oryzae]QGU28455.1 DUF402 domain-containing protein [Microbacterium oryzae]